ncbi:hypothetical protein Tter_2676 [Thermobaculum terrenum ATCC BAA-798]|uniref:Polymerase nucleotidyl transferase domain-containing protein n=2 Tax=Thermobaculum TaxID=262406 RepID=D1CIJ3_THET1|nr:hypothetical protein Tter_2676 [Thermobaculum terrenum ATCC BAA-798]
MERDRVRGDVEALLLHACKGSEVRLRGSLAQGVADAYSDIDLLWVVPDERFDQCLAMLPSILWRVHPVESLRYDPDLQRSRKRRLVFVRFAGLPLFWRLDLEVRATSVAGDESYDLGNPEARGEDWDYVESALANAVAAIKAELRGRHSEAAHLLANGFQKVGLTPPQEADLGPALRTLLDHVERTSPRHTALTRAVRILAEDRCW